MSLGCRSPATFVDRFLGQAEIEILGLIAFGDKDVSRLDVAMGDASCMSRIEGVSHLNREFD